MKRILPFFLVFMSLTGAAQIDTEFWFGAPQLTNGNGAEAPRNSPIFIVVSALNQPSQVIISQPANLSFAPIILNLAANTTQQVNLSTWLNLIQTEPANEVDNSGLLIRATKPITAYYEVRSANNTDLFSLKGKNALGTKFYTPFQNLYGNQFILNGLLYDPSPRAGFIVVASDDNTTVSITPRVDVLGHPATETFQINLNRGQTYYVEALDNTLASKPIGTLIESDKPIAVTTKDDMIDVDITTDGNADIAADQLISYEHTGLRHIVIKGNLSNNADLVAVLATADGTEVTIDGSGTPIILNEGEQHVYNMDFAASFIESTEKVYVFHTSGVGEQLAGALIPALECTGSNQVGFARTNGQIFLLTLTIRAGAEGNFLLNGNPNLIQASAFSPVPGSNGEYVYAKIEFPTSAIPAGGATSTVTNFSDELFHLGIISRPTSAAANYGYFSAFSFLNIGDNSQVCLGDTIELDAGPGKTSYLWNTGETTQNIEVTSPGEYYVEVFSGSDCAATDTVQVTYYEPPINLGENDTICDGTSLTFSFEGNYLFEWQDGSNSNSYTVDEEGIYWVQVSDFQQCALRDSVEIFTSPRPDPEDISGELQYCAGETISLELPIIDNATYRFIDPDGVIYFQQNLTIPNAQLENSGTYEAYFIVEGCESFSDFVEVVVNPNPIVQLPDDVSFCEGENYTITPVLASGDFSWQDGSTAATFEATTSGTYYLDVVNEFGCAGADTMMVEFRPLPENPVISGEELFCEGESITLSTSAQDGAIYSWTGPDEAAIPGENTITIDNVTQNSSGAYTVSIELDGCFSESASFSVQVLSIPVISLQNDTTVCTGNEITLEGPEGFETYVWNTGEETPFISVGAGEYSLTVTNEAGCAGSASVTISESNPVADFQIFPDTVVAPTTLITFVDTSEPGDFDLTNWFWTFGEGTQSNLQNPAHVYTAPGTYQIVMVVFDSEGCTDEASASVVVKFDFEIPEGFSPNGDGINDFFVINGLEEFPGTGFQVFNRWGQEVYRSLNYPNNWDGKDAVDGTYFFILNLPNGENLNGTVFINR